MVGRWVGGWMYGAWSSDTLTGDMAEEALFSVSRGGPDPTGDDTIVKLEHPGGGWGGVLGGGRG